VKVKELFPPFFLQSDDLDEIDIELFGGDEYEWQSNYFVQGNTSTYDRGGYHSINPSPLTNYHKYAINWTKDSLDWIVDGSVIRSLHITNSQGYPQSPMRIYAGIWAGGDPSNEEGTILWAGGETDYSQAPFTMHIKSITAIDYSTGSEYSYSDQSGYWQSIDAKDGEVNGRYSDAQSDVNKAVNGDSIENSGSSDSPSTTQSSSESSSTTESSSESSSTTESSSESSSTTENSSSFSESTQESQSSSEPNSSASSAETTETSESTQTTRGGANKVETDASSFSSSVATTSAETDSSEQETTTSSSSSSDETHSVSSSSENSACRFTSPRSMQFVTVLVSFVSFGFVLV